MNMKNKVLNELGIQTKDKNGKPKTVNQVLTDISDVYVDLTEEQKVYYSEKLFDKE